MTKNEHTITLSDSELDIVTGGLNPQPLPPGPPPPDSFRSFASIFRGFGINQHFALPTLNLFRFF